MFPQFKIRIPVVGIVNFPLSLHFSTSSMSGFLFVTCKVFFHLSVCLLFHFHLFGHTRFFVSRIYVVICILLNLLVTHSFHLIIFAQLVVCFLVSLIWASCGFCFLVIVCLLINLFGHLSLVCSYFVSFTYKHLIIFVFLVSLLEVSSLVQLALCCVSLYGHQFSSPLKFPRWFLGAPQIGVMVEIR